MMDPSALDGELLRLRAKAAKRRNVAGFAANAVALEVRIRALEIQRAATLNAAPGRAAG